MLQENFAHGVDAFNNSNYTEALNLLKPFAEEGNSEAQCIIGNLYHLGLGVEISGIEAIKWYVLSAKQGSAIAANNLASIYFLGDCGIKKDNEEALKWCRLSQDQGFEDSKYLETYILTHSSNR
jgi:hypothetical protein